VFNRYPIDCAQHKSAEEPNLADRKKEFFSGVRDTFPLLLGAFPFGMIYGALAVTAGLSKSATMAMSAFVFAGSSQFIAVGLVAAHAPIAIIILTTFIVNLRHMLYSATLLPYLKNLPQKWRIPLAFGLTDETFAVTIHRYRRKDSLACAHWYQLGSSTAMYLNWQFWSLIGLLLGDRIPDASNWGLDVAMPVTFIGMIIPFVKSWPMGICVLTAAAASLMTLSLPYKLGIVVSAFAGIAAGLVAERNGKKRKTMVPA
jgi:4-azaleucine resistance transporter AzlC